MKLEIDEQLLTAYALNELPVDQRPAVEAYLAANPEAAAEVESIRTMAGVLQDELTAETAAAGLLPTPVLPAAMAIRRSRRVESMLAMAASVALVAGSITVLIHVADGNRIDRFATAQHVTHLSQSGDAIALNAGPQSGIGTSAWTRQWSPGAAEALQTSPGDTSATKRQFDQLAADKGEASAMPKPQSVQSNAANPATNGVTGYVSGTVTGGRQLDHGVPYSAPGSFHGAGALPSPIKVADASGKSILSQDDKAFDLQRQSQDAGHDLRMGSLDAAAVGKSKSDYSDGPDFKREGTAVTGGRELGLPAASPSDPNKPGGSAYRYAVATPPPSDQPQAFYGRAYKGLPPQSEQDSDRKGLALNGVAALQKAGGAADRRAGDQVVNQLQPFGSRGGPNQVTQPVQDIGPNTESYDRVIENPFLAVTQNPLSTFSIDVDTASYSNVRRFLTQGQLPPKDAVRIEEMVNYFPYHYETPKDGDKPFAANVEVAGCPWNAEHRLVRIGIKGKEISAENRPASNLVFLIDVSGSMNMPNKLPLVKDALRKLVNKLDARDRVAIVTYAGQSGLALESTSVGGFTDQDVNDLWHKKYEPQLIPDPKGGWYNEALERSQFADEVAQLKQQRSGKQQILNAIDALNASGGTNGGAGIETAYATAESSFIKGGVNRVILSTDGDFNVGVTNQGDLTRMIEDKAKSGVFLSVLGFGMGNVKDSTMEHLADKGNGNYAYIDTAAEAQKVLVDQMSGTLVTIAKDVKIQVEFNPAKVGSYRLIGYEKRLLAKEDFNDDKKDAGEIGAGHTITALYEVEPPTAKPSALPTVDPLKYQEPARNSEATPSPSNDLLTLKIRYKAPDAPIEQGTSKLLEFPVVDEGAAYGQASEDFKFAAAVASFAMVLRDSEYKGSANLNGVLELAQEGVGADANGYRAEFISLVKQAKAISGQ